MKQKVCSRCEKPKRIWARGLCKSCDIASNPKKYMIEKKRGERKKKSESVSVLKKKLDEVYSLYIRNKYADSDGLVECYTCEVKKPVKEMQNGHFYSRAKNSTRWEDDNCRPQCYSCNVAKKGNYIVYTEKMQQELGEEKYQALKDLANSTFQVKSLWLQEQIAFYKKLLAQWN